MLMPYLALYLLSKFFSLAQGKLSQPKQYFALEFTIFSQLLIRHMIRTFALRLSSPRQPGHGFLSLVYAMQRRQFIPQGAISFEEIEAVFVFLLAFCIKAIMKRHSTTSFVLLERQCKNVLLRNAINDQIWEASEAEPLVVAGISHEHAALCIH